MLKTGDFCVLPGALPFIWIVDKALSGSLREDSGPLIVLCHFKVKPLSALLAATDHRLLTSLPFSAHFRLFNLPFQGGW